MISRRGVMAAGAAAPLAGGLWALGGRALAAGAAQPPSIEELTRRPATHGAALSPDGNQLAVLHEQPQGDKHIAFVTLTDLANPSAKGQPIVIGPYKVERIEWANTDRLLVWVRSDRVEVDNQGGTYVRQKIEYSLRRVVSVDRAGHAVILLGDNASAAEAQEDLSQVIDLLPDDPDHVLMQFWDPRIKLPAVHKVDVATGGSVLLEAGVDNTFFFATANGTPVLRWDVLTPRTQAIYARAIGETGWKFVRKVRLSETDNGDFEPVGLVGDDPNLWLTRTTDPDKPYSNLVTLNLKTLELGAAPVVSHAEFGEPLFDAHQKFFAAELEGDRTDYEFADKSLAGHYRAMNKFFDNQCNVDLVSWSPDHNRLVALVTGPTEPGVYYLYDRAARRFDVVDEQRSWLRDRLASVEMLDLKTRDGVAMRAYLHVPIAAAGAGPRPLVVMPHGGPEDHDTYCFDVVAQTFAARGWLVLQPNFRGSSGYGVDFALAGRRHWGDRMQEDVEDAVAFVLASGRADPKRVAIWGGSYGGYAALMGAVRRPELYKAAVSLAGVSDLIESLAFEQHREGVESVAYKYWRSQLGDPSTDADAMIAASPRRRAKEITAPVLLLHGSKDIIVDPNQSRMMADALKGAGKAVDYVVLDGEGHHMNEWKDKTTTLVLTRSCDFIAKAFA